MVTPKDVVKLISFQSLKATSLLYITAVPDVSHSKHTA